MLRYRRPAVSLAVVVAVVLSVLPVFAVNYVVGSPVTVSGPSPFTPGCEGTQPAGSVAYTNAEVEPWIDVNPTNPNNLIGAWQQDRFSDGGARGLLTAASFDGGLTWTRTWAPFSLCAGGTAANGGDYERATDPWVSFGPDGTAHQISLSFNATDPTNAVLVSKSADGGLTWSAPTTLIRDTAPTVFNDKQSITADPTNANYVYAVWDRLVFPTEQARGRAFEKAVGGKGPTLLSRSTDGGNTWEAPRPIVDGGALSQTIGNQIVVLPNGDLVNVYNLIFYARNNNQIRGLNVAVSRSTDKGLTWSQPIIIDKLQTVLVVDPDNGHDVRTGDIIPDIAVDPGNGNLYVVWQDGRFSGYAHDDIALSQSTDGGFTWSAPVKVNKTTNNAAAFTAAVHVAADGTVGVTHYDFRNNTSAAGVPTDYWLVTCSSGDCADDDNWTETHVAGPFDMETAPDARGYFVGDYEGLASVGNTFLPFFVQANNGDTSNRTDVFFTTAGP